MEKNKQVQFHNRDASEAAMHPNPAVDWFIRMIKGIIIGIGAILPGLSGGVLAVIFGVYDPLLKFLADIRHKFIRNILYFLPVIIGAGIGILLFSFVVEAAFGKYAAQFTCLFIGFVAGTFPSLYRTAGIKGRNTKAWVAFFMAAIGIFVLMLLGEQKLVDVQPNVFSWVWAGAVVGLGMIVPGMSPSNFLIYFGMYDKMASGIASLNFGVIIPLALGLVICILLFAKFVSYLFKKAYSVMYHIILGLVVGSSLAILPTIVAPSFASSALAFSGLSATSAVAFCIVLFIVGAVASYLFSKVEDKYPHESIV